MSEEQSDEELPQKLAPNREKGDRFREIDDVLRQLEEIEQAQQLSRE